MQAAGTIRTRLVQMDVLPARPCENTARILDAVADARREQTELVIFPEMAVPGYLVSDEWEHETFLRECEACGREIRAASQGLTVVFGNVALDWDRRNEDGRVRKYNALFVADDGRFKGPASSPYDFVIKVLLPNYREFDDSRHFFDLRKLALEENRTLDSLVGPVQTNRLSLGCILCEDAWDMDYSVSPLDLLSRGQPDLCINISASPFTLNKNHKRSRVFSAHAVRLGRPLVYVNHVGMQDIGKTVFTFDGSSCIYDSHGHHVRCGGPFEDTALAFDIPLDPGAQFGEPAELQTDTIADACAALLYGTRRFMQRCGVERVVVGVSGGIDSAVVAALYRRILPRADLLLVNMPSRHNSATTRALSAELTANLDALALAVPIDDSVALTRAQLEGAVAANASGDLRHTFALDTAVLENVQARDRSSRVLAAVAAAFGGVFTCNANKSEATVGYTTLYGDLGGYLANLADLWKGEVYALAEHLNQAVYGREVIPRGCMDVTPSAELSEAQDVDRGKGDPLDYPYHDALFRSWVERWTRATPEDILAWYQEGTLEQELGFEGSIADRFPDTGAFIADLERWWNLYRGMGVAKRIQAPPVLAVKRRAFGFDHRESQLGPCTTRRYGELKARLLDQS